MLFWGVRNKKTKQNRAYTIGPPHYQQILCDPHVAHGSACSTAAIVLKAVIFRMTPRGSALQKRLRDREKEMEADERDRKREKEELEEIRQRLLDEGHPDPDAELRRVCLSVM